MLRVIRELQPTYVVGENVAGLISMENGRTLERILTDLEDEGYRVEVFVIPACGVGAWHRRDRVWIVAHNESNRWDSPAQQKVDAKADRRKEGCGFNNICQDGDATHAPITGAGMHNGGLREGIGGADGGEGTGEEDVADTGLFRPQECQEQTAGIEQCGAGDATDTPCSRMEGSGADRQQEPQTQVGSGLSGCNSTGDGGEDGSTFPGLGRVASRLPDWVDGYFDREPDVPRVATGIKDRVNRLKGLGNAIVPQIAFELFKAIDMINKKKYDL